MADRRPVGALSVALMVIGGVLILSGRAYQFFVHSEWTEAQALRYLGWLWAPGMVAVFLGLWLYQRASRNSAGGGSEK